MRKFNILSISLALLLACSLLAGCSNSKKNNSQKSSAEPIQDINEASLQNTNTSQEESTVQHEKMIESPVNSELRKLSGEKVEIKAGEQTFTVELYDNPTASDLLSQLPLTLSASDYAGYDEKIIRLNKALSMENAPEGDEPGIPEVGYYEPGNWIALYYGYIGYWSGKVPLGKINATTLELSEIPDGTQIIITKIEN